MDKTIAWIHADNLNPKQIALKNEIPAIFVWDDALLAEWNISFKRIVFIYECLLELPVSIRRGNVAEEVYQFASEYQATTILTSFSPSPQHRTIIEEIQTKQPAIDIQITKDDAFIDYDGYIDLKRFSRYWKKVQKYALKPTNK